MPTARITIPILSIVILNVLVAGCSLFSKGPDRYYAIAEGPVDMAKGAPVKVDKVDAGEILQVMIDPAGGGRAVLCFEIGGEYSIPVNSLVRIVNDGDEGKGYMAIVVKASKSYYQEGDTITNSVIVNPPAVKPGRKAEKEMPVYKVQLLASSKKLEKDSPYFKGLKDIEEDLTEGVYKYYTGPFEDPDSAISARNKAVELGIRDAFIVPFLQGRRISVKEAAEYEK